MKYPTCPKVFHVTFARQLIAYVGGDPELIQRHWCWKDFLVYKDLRPAIENYFASVSTGDPSWAAYRMVRDCGSDRKWGEGVIEKYQTDSSASSAWAAYCMVDDCGSDRKWAERVIEKVSTGDPSWAAYRMVRDCGSDYKWAEEVIEKLVS